MNRATYNVPAIWLHWITAALIASVLPLAWVMKNMAEHDPNAGTLYMLHKSVGITILVVVLARLAWRASHPAPPLAGRTGAGLAAVAKTSHWLLYAALLAMPISGYLLSATSPFPPTWFGITLPVIGQAPMLHSVSVSVHLLGQWVIYGLVGLHVLAAAWHVAIRRDGTLDRILPPQTH